MKYISITPAAVCILGLFILLSGIVVGAYLQMEVVEIFSTQYRLQMEWAQSSRGITQ